MDLRPLTAQEVEDAWISRLHSNFHSDFKGMIGVVIFELVVMFAMTGLASNFAMPVVIGNCVFGLAISGFMIATELIINTWRQSPDSHRINRQPRAILSAMGQFCGFFLPIQVMFSWVALLELKGLPLSVTSWVVIVLLVVFLHFDVIAAVLVMGSELNRVYLFHFFKSTTEKEAREFTRIINRLYWPILALLLGVLIASLVPNAEPIAIAAFLLFGSLFLMSGTALILFQAYLLMTGWKRVVN